MNFLISHARRPQSLKWLPEDQAFSAEQFLLQRIRLCFQIQNRTALELKSTPHGLSCTSPFSGHLVNLKLSPCLRSHSPYGNSAHKHSRVFKHVWLHCSLINKNKVLALDTWEYSDVSSTFYYTQLIRSYRAHKTLWIRTGKVDRWLRWKGGD